MSPANQTSFAPDTQDIIAPWKDFKRSETAKSLEQAGDGEGSQKPGKKVAKGKKSKKMDVQPGAETIQGMADKAAGAGKPGAGKRGERGTASKQDKAMIYEQRVRVGQQIFAINQDLVVTQLVSQGAELRSEGSIHAYAPMYGKAFAGTKGDKEARIYCTAFYGELVSIAGVYKLFETIDQRLLGKAVMFWLEDDQLMVKPLNEQ